MFTHLRRSPGFYRRVWTLSLPLILQNLITTSLGFVDTFMVGLLGQTELSAVTAANSPVFLLQVIVFASPFLQASIGARGTQTPSTAAWALPCMPVLPLRAPSRW